MGIASTRGGLDASYACVQQGGVAWQGGGGRGDSPSTKIFSTSLDQTSLPSLRSLWCLRAGVRLTLEPLERDSMLLLVAEERREGEGERDAKVSLRRR